MIKCVDLGKMPQDYHSDTPLKVVILLQRLGQEDNMSWSNETW